MKGLSLSDTGNSWVRFLFSSSQWPLISAGQGGTGSWEEGRDLFTVLIPVQAYESLSVAGLPGAEAILMVQTPIRN